MDVKTPFFFSMLFVAAMTLWAWVHPADVLAQTSLPRLHKEGQVTRTPFLDQGCHALGCKHHVAPTKSLLVEDNFDMGPSIARSDSFDVVHYDLTLDMTDYWGQPCKDSPPLILRSFKGWDDGVVGPRVSRGRQRALE